MGLYRKNNKKDKKEPKGRKKKGQKEQKKTKEFEMTQEMNLYDDSLYNVHFQAKTLDKEGMDLRNVGRKLLLFQCQPKYLSIPGSNNKNIYVNTPKKAKKLNGSNI